MGGSSFGDPSSGQFPKRRSGRRNYIALGQGTTVHDMLVAQGDVAHWITRRSRRHAGSTTELLFQVGCRPVQLRDQAFLGTVYNMLAGPEDVAHWIAVSQEITRQHYRLGKLPLTHALMLPRSVGRLSPVFSAAVR